MGGFFFAVLFWLGFLAGKLAAADYPYLAIFNVIHTDCFDPKGHFKPIPPPSPQKSSILDHTAEPEINFYLHFTKGLSDCDAPFATEYLFSFKCHI